MADEPVPAPEVSPKPRKPRPLKKSRDRATKLVREAKRLREGERKCTGTTWLRADMRRPAGPDNPHLLNPDGTVQTRPCQRAPIKGGFVCWKHGGGAPQVRKNAEKRLLALVEPSLIRLEGLIQQDEHMPTALGAIRTVLERAGSTAAIGPLAKETGEKDMRPVINIGIKVGGIEKPVVSVGMLPAAEPDIQADIEPADESDEDDQ